MHESRERISTLDTAVLFVSFDTPEQLRRLLLAGIDLAFPLGIDPERETYRRWGLVRAPWWRIWLDPGVWIRYAQLMRSGERIRGRGADPLQLGGDFVIAPDGRVAYARPQIRDDRPAVGELLAIASRLRGG